VNEGHPGSISDVIENVRLREVVSGGRRDGTRSEERVAKFERRTELWTFPMLESLTLPLRAKTNRVTTIQSVVSSLPYCQWRTCSGSVTAAHRSLAAL